MKYTQHGTIAETVLATTDGQEAIARYRRNRAKTDQLFALLSDEAYYAQPITLRHPIVFYEGHLPGFSLNTFVKKALGKPGIDARLEALFARHTLSGLVDGAVSTLIPARYAWESIESGRIGTRHAAILALDAIAKPRGTNALLLPVLRVASATADRDRAFWDLHVNFQRAPNFLDIFPSDARLARAARCGEEEFAETARILPKLLARVPPWKDLSPEAIAHVDDRFS